MTAQLGFSSFPELQGRPPPWGRVLLTLISQDNYKQTLDNPEEQGSSIGLPWVMLDYPVMKRT